MTKIYEKLTELVGRTPLVDLQRLAAKKNAQAQVVAKVEFFNPGGSVKDRIALNMIEDAEKKGILKPGSVIIEPTSGNTGVGLAWISRVKGYEAIIVMPETMSKERQNLLRAAGAKRLLGLSSWDSLSIPPIPICTSAPRVRRYGRILTEWWTSLWLEWAQVVP